MFCTNCGNAVPDGSTFCPECGQNLAIGATPGPTAAQQTPPAQQVPPQGMPAQPHAAQPPVGQRIDASTRKQVVASAEQAGLGMKWYKFLIYFLLIANAVFSVIIAICYFSGATYVIRGATPFLVWRTKPAFILVDVFWLIANLALGVAYAYCRVLMARLSKKAPKLLYVTYIIYGASTLIHQLAVMAIFGYANVAYLSNTVTTLLGSGLGIALNKIYFDKRAHLFVYD